MESLKFIGELVCRFAEAAQQARPILKQVYGAEKGAKLRYAETFEMSRYSRQLPPPEFQRLFLP